MKLKNIKLPKSFYKIKAKAIKYGPDIAMAAGGVLVVVGFVNGIISATKAEEILDEREEMLEKIDKVIKEYPDEYSEEDHKKDIVIVQSKTLWKFVKLFGLSVVLTGGGLLLMYTGYGKMRKRYVNAVAAYSGVLGLLNEYRQRVRDEVGEDKERELYFDSKKVKAKILDENGKKQNVEAEVINGYSPYAFFFDESCDQWDKNPYYNKTFLIGIENNMNDLLHRQGYVTLADIKNQLSTDGILVKPEDLAIGWVLGNGDDRVDLGIFEACNEAHRDFVNGLTNTILLDPNVDGWIMDKI